MSAPELPTSAQAEQVDLIAEDLYDLLQSRALSLGIMDIALEVDGWFVDAELLFAIGPDMGLSMHAGAGEVRYCELLGSEGERWLEQELDGVAALGAHDEDARGAVALRVLQGMLDARRPLLPKD